MNRERLHRVWVTSYEKELAPDDAYFSIATPYPGTPLYELCKERGYIPKDLGFTRIRPTQAVINTPQLSQKEVMDLRDLAYYEWGKVRPTRPEVEYRSPMAIERRLGVEAV